MSERHLGCMDKVGSAKGSEAVCQPVKLPFVMKISQGQGDSIAGESTGPKVRCIDSPGTQPDGGRGLWATASRPKGTHSPKLPSDPLQTMAHYKMTSVHMMQ